MPIRVLAVLLLLLTILFGCYKDTGNNKIEKIEFQYKTQHFTLGSINHVNEIIKIENTQGVKEALNKVMNDVNMFNSEIDSNNELNNKRLYMLVSRLVYRLGYVDMNVHYFRNKLNRAPKSLKELLQLNSTLPKSRQWRLASLRSSIYHCQGKEGLYNLKFTAYDGFCEAVYNKNGVLLTEKNDPINMGTFNYAAGMHNRNSHGKYDIKPYLKWGNSNSSPQKGANNIKNGVNTALKIYNKNSLSIDKYRDQIIKTFTDFR
ncbi:MAG TPA: hypothetical protein VIO64_17495 [Pseudobacteroides sp.]|uniref:hypothetical protein n=1 Tax=Pseudobacteroides sp. TaxID=1968840 RepID=UPI002F955D62